MNDIETRLQCLALAMPKTLSDPDTTTVLRRAEEFYKFVIADTAKAPAQSRPILTIPADTGKAARKACGPARA